VRRDKSPWDRWARFGAAMALLYVAVVLLATLIEMVLVALAYLIGKI